MKQVLKKKTLMTDEKKCTGCGSCIFVCSGAKAGSPSRVRVQSFEAEGRFRPCLCIGCTDHPCLFSCPFGAIRFSFRLNMPIIYHDKCTGCGMCVKVCPFEVIFFDSERKKAFKCDVCGGKPECVKACHPGAIVYVPLTKEVAFKKHLQLVSRWMDTNGKLIR